MALPILHSFAGYTVYRATKREGDRTQWALAAFCMLLANLADFDLVAEMFLPGRYHHGVSHSLGAAVFVAFIVACVVAALSPHPNPLPEGEGTSIESNKFPSPRRGEGRVRGGVFLRTFLLCFAAYYSHVLIDFLSGPRGGGVPMLWPLSAAYYSTPISFFLGNGPLLARIHSLQDLLMSLLAPGSLVRIAYESGLVAGLWVLSRWRLRKPALEPLAVEA